MLEGASRLEAARQSGMDRQTLRDWVHRYNEAGVKGLFRAPPWPEPEADRGADGGTARAGHRRPRPEIHKVVRWRCIDLREEVARRFSVTVGERTIGKWLRKLKLTRLQPRPYHPKKDAAAQEAFKKTSVPILKTSLVSATCAGTPVEIWFQDEARVGQKGSLVTSGLQSARARQWCGTTATILPTSSARSARPGASARRSSRPPPTECMNLHLAEISTQVAPGSIAVVICDGAGWHQPGGELKLPDNIVLLHLPPMPPN